MREFLLLCLLDAISELTAYTSQVMLSMAESLEVQRD